MCVCVRVCVCVATAVAVSVCARAADGRVGPAMCIETVSALALNLKGGSIIGSRDRTNVPQCIPITFLLLKFLSLIHI